MSKIECNLINLLCKAPPLRPRKSSTNFKFTVCGNQYSFARRRIPNTSSTVWISSTEEKMLLYRASISAKGLSLPRMVFLNTLPRPSMGCREDFTYLIIAEAYMNCPDDCWTSRLISVSDGQDTGILYSCLILSNSDLRKTWMSLSELSSARNAVIKDNGSTRKKSRMCCSGRLVTRKLMGRPWDLKTPERVPNMQRCIFSSPHSSSPSMTIRLGRKLKGEPFRSKFTWERGQIIKFWTCISRDSRRMSGSRSTTASM